MDKPEWWPKNPYPESVFPMKLERYAEIVPDPELRTGLSGVLGRIFWEIASNTIWEAVQDNIQAEVRHPINSNNKINHKRNYCYFCGATVKNQKYCHNCGQKLLWPIKALKQGKD